MFASGLTHTFHTVTPAQSELRRQLIPTARERETNISLGHWLPQNMI